MRSRSGGHGLEAMGFDGVRSPVYSGEGLRLQLSRLGFGIECMQKYQHHAATVRRTSYGRRHTIFIHYQVTCDRCSVFEVNAARFDIYSGDFLAEFVRS